MYVYVCVYIYVRESFVCSVADGKRLGRRYLQAKRYYYGSECEQTASICEPTDFVRLGEGERLRDDNPTNDNSNPDVWRRTI